MAPQGLPSPVHGPCSTRWRSWPVAAAAGGRHHGGRHRGPDLGPGYRPAVPAGFGDQGARRRRLLGRRRGGDARPRRSGPEGSTVRHLLSHASGLGPDQETRAAAVGTRRIYSNAGSRGLGRTWAAASGLDARPPRGLGVCEPLAWAPPSLTRLTGPRRLVHRGGPPGPGAECWPHPLERGHLAGRDRLAVRNPR